MRPPRHVLALVLATALAAALSAQTLAGFDSGLYRLEPDGSSKALWLGGEIKKIIRSEAGWYFLGSRGVLFSSDLKTFEERNRGFPVKTIKRYEKGIKSFQYEIQDLKDLEVDPYDPKTLVTCTKDSVFLSRDGGLSWTALPPAPSWTTGLKAVAVVSGPENLIFASHPIRGTFSRPLGGSGVPWTVVPGLASASGSTSVDEVSDIVAAKGTSGAQIWAANSFLPRLYRWDSGKRAFVPVYADDREFACFESLQVREDGVLYLTDGEVFRFDPRTDRNAVEPRITAGDLGRFLYRAGPA